MAKETWTETIEESRKKYTEYIENHIANVKKAFDLFGKQLHDIIEPRHSDKRTSWDMDRDIIQDHDLSKYEPEEFEAYRKRFFPSKEDDLTNVKENFDTAWAHHYHKNPHHPEFWTLNIRGEDSIIPMTNQAMVEMLCDWIAMSIGFHSSTYDWWFNNPGGRAEKCKIMLPEDIDLVDKIITKYKNDYDFSVS